VKSEKRKCQKATWVTGRRADNPEEGSSSESESEEFPASRDQLKASVYSLRDQNQEIFQYCYKKSLEVKPNYPESLEELWKHA
jgi:hypothetical protein